MTRQRRKRRRRRSALRSLRVRAPFSLWALKWMFSSFFPIELLFFSIFIFIFRPSFVPLLLPCCNWFPSESSLQYNFVRVCACVSTTSTCFNFNRTEYNDRAVTVVPWWWRWCRGGGSGGEMMKGVSPTGTEGALTALGATFSTYGYEQEMRQHRKTATLQVGCWSW